MSNMVGLLLEAAIAYLSRALGSPPYNIGHYDPLLCSLLISDCTDQFLPVNTLLCLLIGMLIDQFHSRRYKQESLKTCTCLCNIYTLPTFFCCFHTYLYKNKSSPAR